MVAEPPPRASAAKAAAGPSHRLAIYLLAGVLLGWLALFGWSLSAAALPRDRAGLVTVVFPPGTDRETMLAAVVAAEGRPVRETMFDTIWVVHSERPGFVGRLEAVGAWAAFDPVAFDPVDIAGCFLAPLRARVP